MRFIVAHACALGEIRCEPRLDIGNALPVCDTRELKIDLILQVSEGRIVRCVGESGAHEHCGAFVVACAPRHIGELTVTKSQAVVVKQMVCRVHSPNGIENITDILASVLGCQKSRIEVTIEPIAEAIERVVAPGFQLVSYFERRGQVRVQRFERADVLVGNCEVEAPPHGIESCEDASLEIVDDRAACAFVVEDVTLKIDGKRAHELEPLIEAIAARQADVGDEGVLCAVVLHNFLQP